MLTNKLLIVSPIFPPDIGGPATYVSNLSQRLQKKLEVKVISFGSKTLKQTYPFKVRLISPKGGIVIRQAKLLLSVLTSAFFLKHIYLHGTVVVGLPAVIVAKVLNKSIILKFVGDEVWESSRVVGSTKKSLEDYYASPPQSAATHILLHRFVLNSAEKIIVPSNYLKQFLVKSHHVKENKIHVINNAVETKVRGGKNRRLKHQLLFVGRLVPWKNVDQIIKAIKISRKKYPWELNIVGDGPQLKELKKLSQKLNMEKHVRFLGKVPKTEVLQHMSTCTALVLYSSYEGQPHTLIEAFFSKTPILASDIPPHQELVKGQLVKSNNIQELAKQINNKLGTSRLNKTQKDYSWESHIQELLKVFNE